VTDAPFNKQRLFRLGALAVVIVAGIAFHQKAGSYAVVRIAYFALILLLFFTRTRYGAGRRRAVGKRRGRLFGAGIGTGTGAASSAPPTDRPLGAPGWVRDGVDPSIEQYWDGSAWTRRRRWNGKEWIDGGS
jgi:hypothetical protein